MLFDECFQFWQIGTRAKTILIGPETKRRMNEISSMEILLTLSGRISIPDIFSESTAIWSQRDENLAQNQGVTRKFLFSGFEAKNRNFEKENFLKKKKFRTSWKKDFSRLILCEIEKRFDWLTVFSVERNRWVFIQSTNGSRVTSSHKIIRKGTFSFV